MKKTRKEDCVLWNEHTTVPHCALEEKAQKEYERDGKCGTYECPFFKKSLDEIRTSKPSLEDRVKELASIMRKGHDGSISQAIELIEDITGETWAFDNIGYKKIEWR